MTTGTRFCYMTSIKKCLLKFSVPYRQVLVFVYQTVSATLNHKVQLAIKNFNRIPVITLNHYLVGSWCGQCPTCSAWCPSPSSSWSPSWSCSCPSPSSSSRACCRQPSPPRLPSGPCTVISFPPVLNFIKQDL